MASNYEQRINVFRWGANFLAILVFTWELWQVVTTWHGPKGEGKDLLPFVTINLFAFIFFTILEAFAIPTNVRGYWAILKLAMIVGVAMLGTGVFLDGVPYWQLAAFSVASTAVAITFLVFIIKAAKSNTENS